MELYEIWFDYDEENYEYLKENDLAACYVTREN